MPKKIEKTNKEETAKKEDIVFARSRYVRTSVKKSFAVANLIRGKSLEEAKKILTFHGSKAGEILLKTLKSAELNAINNSKLSRKDLYVSEAYVNEGPLMKRRRIVARSRFSPILKRTSHVVIGLSSRESGNDEKRAK